MLSAGSIFRILTSPAKRKLVTAGLHTTTMVQAKVAVVSQRKYYVKLEKTVFNFSDNCHACSNIAKVLL